jgi:hypothetical protein
VSRKNVTSNVILGRELDDTLSGLQTEHDETVEARVAGGLECAGYGLGVSRLIELQLQPNARAAASVGISSAVSAQSAHDTISVNSRRVSMMSSLVCGDQSASSRTIRGRCHTRT